MLGAERSLFSIPADLTEALRIRADTGACPLAGGTDLMVRCQRGSGLIPSFSAPLLLVSRLRELSMIEKEGESLRIGAACTFSSLLLSPAVPPALKLAISEIGSPAIRNLATLGGNICNASPAADTLPFLYATDALVELQSSGGRRILPIQQFITGPGKTELKAGELLAAVLVPEKSFPMVFYRKVGTRKANALAKLSFLGLAAVERGRIREVRCAFGGVSPTVVRSLEIESRLQGRDRAGLAGLSAETREAFAALIHPIDDQRSTASYRKAVSLRLLESFLGGLF